MAILCESYLLGQHNNTQNSYHRLSHVWNLQEESILPIPQVLKILSCDVNLKEMPFLPDGVYPENGEVIFYKNPTADTPLAQSKTPFVENVDDNE